MKCKEFEELCLTKPDSLSSEARKHLENCSECQKFFKLIMLLEKSSLSPAADLDKRTISAALPILQAKRERVYTGYRRIVAIAAALLILLTIAVLYTNNPKDVPDTQLAKSEIASQELVLTEAEEAELWYLAGEAAGDELDDLELQLYLYANSP